MDKCNNFAINSKKLHIVDDAGYLNILMWLE